MNPTPPTLEQIASQTAERVTDYHLHHIINASDTQEVKAIILQALQTATKQPEGADWAELKEKIDEVLGYHFEDPDSAFMARDALLKQVLRPLVANREDSERLERISNCAGFTICHWHDGYQISRCCTTSDQMTGPKFPTLREALDEHFDAAIRPAQPERGQGEGT